MWPWINYLTSLKSYFPTAKKRKKDALIESTHSIVWRLGEIIYNRHFGYALTHNIYFFSYQLNWVLVTYLYFTSLKCTSPDWILLHVDSRVSRPCSLPWQKMAGVNQLLISTQHCLPNTCIEDENWPIMKPLIWWEILVVKYVTKEQHKAAWVVSLTAQW